MGKKDYTKYSNHQKKTEEIQNGIVETPVVEETVVEEVVEAIEFKPKHGVVVDCTKLNVRVEPNAKADVVCVVDASTDLEIDEEASTEEFYKVCTATGAEGFCMKKFIKILP